MAVLLGIALRFWALGAKSLWGDEIISLALATGHPWYPSPEEMVNIYKVDHYRAALSLAPTYFSQRLNTLLQADTQPPLYYFLLNIWLHLFGPSPVSLRSLSVLVSIASIPLIYTLGRRISSIDVGVYSALIFSVAPFQLAFAQHNRPYALLGFFTLFSTLAVVRICQGAGGWQWLLVYACVAIMGLYTQYLFIWNLVFHWILVGVSQRHNPRLLLRWGIAQAFVGAVFLLWIPVFFEQMRWNREAASLTWFYWASKPLSLSDAVLYLGRGLALLLSVGRIEGFCLAFTGGDNCRLDTLLTGFFYIVPIIVLSICAWQFVTSLQRRTREKCAYSHAWWLCIFWAICILSGPIVIDVMFHSRTITMHRYLIAASGPIYIAVAMAFTAVIPSPLRVGIVSGFLVFLLTGSMLSLQGFSGTLIYKQGMKEVAQYLDRSVSDNDLILLLNPGPNPMDLAYYLRSNPAVARVNMPERWQTSLDIPDQLHKLTLSRHRVWYLDDLGPEIPARKMTLTWLDTHFEKKVVNKFKNLDLFLFSSH
jgi:uncharacterized membrane protein